MLQGSPVCVNVTPLQIELLERDLEELRTSFNEAKKDNLHLQEVIEKQKLYVIIILIHTISNKYSKIAYFLK